MASYTINVTCPYCGFKFNTIVDFVIGGDIIQYCPLDEGGCDRKMVLSVAVQAIGRAFKIEGEI